MAWAIFHERFIFDRRPKQAVSFNIPPSPLPQRFPKDVIEAAIVAGKATAAKTPRPEQRRALMSRKAGK